MGSHCSRPWFNLHHNSFLTTKRFICKRKLKTMTSMEEKWDQVLENRFVLSYFQVPVKVTGAKVKCTLKWIDISFYWMSCRTHPSLSCKISRQNIKPRFSGTDAHSLYLRLLFRLPPDVIPFFNGKQTLEKEGLQYSTPGGTVTAKWACDWVHTMTSACLCSLRAIIDIIYNNRYK